MRKVEVCRKFTDLGCKEQRTLSYFITVDTVADNISESPLEYFGVSVSIDEISEEASVRGITFSYSRIHHLTDILATNLVTPISLPDVVSDWLDQ